MKCQYLLTQEEGWCKGTFEVADNIVTEWETEATGISPSEPPAEYLAEGLPVEYHCHGIGPFDFSEFDTGRLYDIDDYLYNLGIYCVITGFLPINNLDRFDQFMFSFNQEKKAGKLSNILGVSLEGPLLSSIGGTPQKGTWAPSGQQWKQLVKHADGRLPYIVISPEALLEGGSFYHTTSMTGSPDLEWIIELLLDHGIRPSLGHFRKTSPETGVQSIHRVMDIIEKRGHRLNGPPIVTDHLFNDMPLSFKHAWRTPEERLTRRQDLEDLDLNALSIANVTEKLGAVPGAIIKGARDGLIVPSINFDGDHVDLEISRHIVDLLGSGSIIAMTDNTSLTRYLCGTLLSKNEFNTLLYQDNDVVAAGTQNIVRQIEKLNLAGFKARQIWDMVSFVPYMMAGKEGQERRGGHQRQQGYTHFRDDGFNHIYIKHPEMRYGYHH